MALVSVTGLLQGRSRFCTGRLSLFCCSAASPKCPCLSRDLLSARRGKISLPSRGRFLSQAAGGLPAVAAQLLVEAPQSQSFLQQTEVSTDKARVSSCVIPGALTIHELAHHGGERVCPGKHPDVLLSLNPGWKSHRKSLSPKVAGLLLPTWAQPAWDPDRKELGEHQPSFSKPLWGFTLS